MDQSDDLIQMTFAMVALLTKGMKADACVWSTDEADNLANGRW